jgi:hypothetical protein
MRWEVTNDKQVRIWKEAVVICLKLLNRKLLEGTEGG